MTSRGLCGAFSWVLPVLIYSSGLIVYVGRSPPYLLGLGFHADADAARIYYLFRICFSHVIVFLFYFFFHTRKVSESRVTMRS